MRTRSTHTHSHSYPRCSFADVHTDGPDRDTHARAHREEKHTTISHTRVHGKNVQLGARSARQRHAISARFVGHASIDHTHAHTHANTSRLLRRTILINTMLRVDVLDSRQHATHTSTFCWSRAAPTRRLLGRWVIATRRGTFLIRTIKATVAHTRRAPPRKRRPQNRHTHTHTRSRCKCATHTLTVKRARTHSRHGERRPPLLLALMKKSPRLSGHESLHDSATDPQYEFVSFCMFCAIYSGLKHTLRWRTHTRRRTNVVSGSHDKTEDKQQTPNSPLARPLAGWLSRRSAQ